jgi:hypothetical protein
MEGRKKKSGMANVFQTSFVPPVCYHDCLFLEKTCTHCPTAFLAAEFNGEDPAEDRAGKKANVLAFTMTCRPTLLGTFLFSPSNRTRLLREDSTPQSHSHSTVHRHTHARTTPTLHTRSPRLGLAGGGGEEADAAAEVNGADGARVTALDWRDKAPVLGVPVSAAVDGKGERRAGRRCSVPR